MNDNILKTQFFQKINFDLKGHLRSHKVIFVFKDKLFFETSYFKFLSIQYFLRMITFYNVL